MAVAIAQEKVFDGSLGPASPSTSHDHHDVGGKTREFEGQEEPNQVRGTGHKHGARDGQQHEGVELTT